MKEFSIMSLGAGVLLLMGCGEQRATQAADESATAREVVNQAGDVLDQETDKPRAVVLVGDGEEFVDLGGKPVKVHVDPEAVLKELLAAKVDKENRADEQRKALFYMECLVLAGDRSLPAIGKFFKRNEDFEYGFSGSVMQWKSVGRSQGQGNDKAVKMPTRSSGYYGMKTDFVMPVSLRLGLFEVLSRIGTKSAEAMLAGMLSESTRGIEIAMLDRVLSDLAEDQYKDEVLATVHELLAVPLEVSRPTQLDSYTRKYLFGVLTKYKDETFAELARNLIVKGNGSIDNDVVNYLNNVLGDRAMPMFAMALKDPGLDPRWMGTLSSYVLRHAGSNADADAFFHKVMMDEQLASLRQGAITALRHGADKEVLKRRLAMLGQYKEELVKERDLQSVIKWVERSLNQQLDPNYKPQQIQWQGQSLRLEGFSGEGGVPLVLPSGSSGATFFQNESANGVIRAYRLESGSEGGATGEILVEPSVGRDGALNIRIQPPPKK